MPSFWKSAPSAIATDDKRRQRESTYAANSRLARIRDGHHCRICGSQFTLETHHVVPRSLVGKLLRDALSNLITVCHEDHRLVTRHVIKIEPVDPALGANGKVRVMKFDAAEKGYVVASEGA
jgi:5-methylcytosine-specific restriction endonuclease McrA